MTAQISDDFIYKQRQWNIAGISEGHLFDPAVFKLKLKVASTACWRGFQAVYSVVDRRLIVTKLTVSLVHPQKPPVLNGVTGEKSDIDFVGNTKYESLNYPLEYTGGVLIASGFIQEMYVHMGYHPAWKYRDVHELVFKLGELIYEADRSAAVAEMREKILASEKERKRYFAPERVDVNDFVARSFNQRYKLG